MLEIIKTLEKKYEEAQERVTRIGQLLDICRDMENRMKWDCMYTDDEADENGERIFCSYADKFQAPRPVGVYSVRFDSSPGNSAIVPYTERSMDYDKKETVSEGKREQSKFCLDSWSA